MFNGIQGPLTSSQFSFLSSRNQSVSLRLIMTFKIHKGALCNERLSLFLTDYVTLIHLCLWKWNVTLTLTNESQQSRIDGKKAKECKIDSNVGVAPKVNKEDANQKGF